METEGDTSGELQRVCLPGDLGGGSLNMPERMNAVKLLQWKEAQIRILLEISLKGKECLIFRRASEYASLRDNVRPCAM